MNEKEYIILEMLKSGANVRAIKETCKCGAEIIKRIRDKHQQEFPEIRTRTRTKKNPKMTDDEIMSFNEEIMAKMHKRPIQSLGTKEQEQKDTNNEEFYKTFLNPLLNHEEILFLEKMNSRMLRHRSIHKNEEPIFSKILNKLKNF